MMFSGRYELYGTFFIAQKHWIGLILGLRTASLGKVSPNGSAGHKGKVRNHTNERHGEIR